MKIIITQFQQKRVIIIWKYCCFVTYKILTSQKNFTFRLFKCRIES